MALLASYQFENNVNDSSGNGKTGAVGGEATFVTPGRVGSYAGLMDGVNDHFVLPIALGIDNVVAMSWGGWFYWTSRADFEALATHGTGANSRLELLLGGSGAGANTGLLFAVTTSANVIFSAYSGAVLTNGQWYHVWANLNLAGATDADKMQIYVNGAPVALTYVTGSSGAPAATPDHADGSTSIGRRHYNASLFQDGMVDDFLIHNQTLSQSAVMATMSGSSSLYSDMGLYGDMNLYE